MCFARLALGHDLSGRNTMIGITRSLVTWRQGDVLHETSLPHFWPTYSWLVCLDSKMFLLQMLPVAWQAALRCHTAELTKQIC